MLRWLSKPGRLGGGESGQALLLIVFLTLLTAMMAALAVDVGFYFASRRDLQNDVDAAALAGAPYLPTDPDKAVDTAFQWAERNGLDGDVSVSFTCTSDYEIACDPAHNVWDTLVVAGERDVDLFFGRIVGLDSLKVNATAAGCSPACGVAPAPVDLVMILDRTNSIGLDDLPNVKNAATAILEVFQPTHQWVGLGAVPPGRMDAPCDYPSNSDVTPENPDWVLVHIADDYQDPDGSLDEGSDLVSTIECLKLPRRSQWQTNLGDPVAAAVEELQLNGRADAPQAIILLSDGAANLPQTWTEQPCQYAFQKAEEAKNLGIEIYTIGYGLENEYCTRDWGSWRNKPAEDLLKAMATDEEHYFYKPKGEDLAPVFQHIGWQLVGGNHLVR